MAGRSERLVHGLKRWASETGSVLRDPREFYGERGWTESYRHLLGFALFSSLASSALFVLVALLSSEISRGTGIVETGAVFVLFNWVFFLADTLVLHLFTKLLGGGNDLKATLEVNTYPSLILMMWFVPGLNLVLGVYLIYVSGAGLSEAHGISEGRAMVSRVLSSMIGWLIIILAVVLLGVAVSGILSFAGFSQAGSTVSFGAVNYTAPQGFEKTNSTEYGAGRSVTLEKSPFEVIMVRSREGVSGEQVYRGNLLREEIYPLNVEGVDLSVMNGSRRWVEMNASGEVEGMKWHRTVFGTVQGDSAYIFDLLQLSEDRELYSDFRRSVLRTEFR